MDIKTEISSDESSNKVRRLAEDERTQAPGFIACIPTVGKLSVDELTFQRHSINNGKSRFLYTARKKSSPNVTRLGDEDKSEVEGCDYAFAVVNRKTGDVQYFPTKLVTFERVTVNELSSIEEFSGEKKIDYAANNTFEPESWADKRRALTSEFGSAKKTKMQDAAKRRQIKDETLSIMMNSAFKSPNVPVKTEEDKVHISLLEKADSSVLPKANHETNIPREVYSLSQFLNEAEIITFKSDAFDQLDQSRKKLVDNGFSSLVYNFMGRISENAERACYVLLLDAMVRCFKIIAKRRFILQTEWTELQYPTTILAKLREKFLRGEFTRANARSKQMKLTLNIIDKDRLLAHILCLALLLDQALTLPITAWAKELGVNELQITKISTALGCSVHAATAAEGIKLGTTRIARLAGPPAQNRRQFNRKR